VLGAEEGEGRGGGHELDVAGGVLRDVGVAAVEDLAGREVDGLDADRGAGERLLGEDLVDAELEARGVDGGGIGGEGRGGSGGGGGGRGDEPRRGREEGHGADEQGEAQATDHPLSLPGPRPAANF
jgi:hypothetical protein